jgi:hypothetical protein
MANSDHILVTWIPAVHAGMTCYFLVMDKLIGRKRNIEPVFIC